MKDHVVEFTYYSEVLRKYMDGNVVVKGTDITDASMRFKRDFDGVYGKRVIVVHAEPVVTRRRL